MTEDGIQLRLSKQQALVFFEWVGRLDSHGDRLFEHPAEEKVIWNLEAQLEKILVEPFAANYREILDKARFEVDSTS